MTLKNPDAIWLSFYGITFPGGYILPDGQKLTWGEIDRMREIFTPSELVDYDSFYRALRKRWEKTPQFELRAALFRLNE